MNPADPQVGRPTTALDQAHWEGRYRDGDTPWDHGEPAPGLVDFLAQTTLATGRVLVPGCGTGHDCRALAATGFAVTGLDLSERAIARAGGPTGIEYQVGDFLALPRSYHGQFDGVFEHTCFCAIDPARRDDYVQATIAALKPGGWYLGIYFMIAPETGPPFGTTRAELEERFGGAFALVREWVPPNWPNRTGEELMMLWRRKLDPGDE